MRRRNKRLSKRVESFLWDKIEPLLKEKLASIDLNALIEQLERVSPEKAEALIQSGLKALDKGGVEQLWREVAGSFDKSKLEDILRDALKKIEKSEYANAARKGAASSAEAVNTATRNLENIDWADIEKEIRQRVDTLVQERLKEVDIDALVGTVREQAQRLDQEQLLNEAKRAGKKVKRTVQDAIPHEAALDNGADALTPSASTSSDGSFLGSLLRGVGGLTLLSGAGWIAYSTFFVNRQTALPKALPADQKTIRFPQAGPLNLYFDTQAEGRPLLFVHSINAAASAHEMRPLFQHYRTQRPVYAVDLPGFGFSARPKIDYTPETYVQAILTVLNEFDGPVDVVAHSLSSEFAAEAARRQPNAVSTLTLISPTGVGSDSNENSFSSWLHPLLSFQLWSRPLYDLVSTERSIRYFLQKSFVGQPPQSLVDYDYATAHQPGAEHAPLAFISGRLFTPNALEAIYRKVSVPTLVIYDRDEFVNFDRLPELLASNKAWRAERIMPSLGLPHWEKLTETVEALDSFWKEQES